MFATYIDLTEALLCGSCHLDQCVSECLAMGNKIVIFTEEQFEDYQVSDTHSNTWFEAFILKKSHKEALWPLWVISNTNKLFNECRFSYQ